MIAAAIERCAGIDVGKKFLAVCLMGGAARGRAPHRDPGVRYDRGGTEKVARLVEARGHYPCGHGEHRLILETGIYVLENAVKVHLANPQDVKNRKGHKTDNKDGWWLAHLLRHAVIQPSFIPPRVIRDLRDLTRRRRRLIGNGSSEKNRVQKILEDVNVKLGNVLADVFESLDS
jgi:transposase